MGGKEGGIEGGNEGGGGEGGAERAAGLAVVAMEAVAGKEEERAE